MIKISKPEIPDNLEVISDINLLWEDTDEDINGYHIKSGAVFNTKTNGLNYTSDILQNCRFNESKILRSRFIDVIFKSCDFSNCDMSESYFKRCEFINCKCVGTNFNNSYFLDVLIKDSNFKYAILDNSKLEYISMDNNDFSNGYYSKAIIKKVELKKVDFSRASFFKTPLKDIDFSDSIIDGIIVSDELSELKGAIVNSWQAADLAALLGLKIK